MANRYGATARAEKDNIERALTKPAEDYQSKENLDAAIDLLERFEYFAAAAELTIKCERLWNTNGTRKRANDAARVSAGTPVAAAAQQMVDRVQAAKADIDRILGDPTATAVSAEIEVPVANGPVAIDPDHPPLAGEHAVDYQDRIAKLLAATAVSARDIDDAALARLKPAERSTSTSKAGIPYDNGASVKAAQERAEPEPTEIDLGAVAWIPAGANAARENLAGLRVNKSRVRLPRAFIAPEYAHLRAGLLLIPTIDAASETLVLEFSAEPKPGFIPRHRSKPEWGVKSLRDGILAAGYEPGDHELVEKANCWIVVRSYQP